MQECVSLNNLSLILCWPFEAFLYVFFFTRNCGMNSSLFSVHVLPLITFHTFCPFSTHNLWFQFFSSVPAACTTIEWKKMSAGDKHLTWVSSPPFPSSEEPTSFLPHTFMLFTVKPTQSHSSNENTDEKLISFRRHSCSYCGFSLSYLLHNVHNVDSTVAKGFILLYLRIFYTIYQHGPNGVCNQWEGLIDRELRQM